jgi:hypothetical protein
MPAAGRASGSAIDDVRAVAEAERLQSRPNVSASEDQALVWR